MAIVKVKKNFQITIPNSLRKKLSIVEGEYMEVEDKDGELIMRPVKMVHPDHEYFYTKEWQKDESEADKDIREGKVIGPFDNVDDCIEALES